MRRVWQHQSGEMEGLTKTYKVNRLVYYECFNDPRGVIAREKEIEGRRRKKKNALVETTNPRWTDLSPMLFQHFKPFLACFSTYRHTTMIDGSSSTLCVSRVPSLRSG
jgi:predicted GIY-YIG superfamily endonuclease